MDKTALGDRMKAYEAVTRFVLPRRTYTVIRVDGRAFHSLLRHAARPFDEDFMELMDRTAEALCAEMAGARFAYACSDEISVLLTDFGSVHTEPWFGGTVQKMASLAASTATACFNDEAMRYERARSLLFTPRRAAFDARVFTIPSAVEVANYFLWRQQDCVRNSISMAAQAHFPHSRLQGLNGDQLQELLWSEKKINWSDYPDGMKRGRVCQRVTAPGEVTFTHRKTGEQQTVTAARYRWVTEDAPHFTAEKGSWLAGKIPAAPGFGPAQDQVE